MAAFRGRRAIVVAIAASAGAGAATPIPDVPRHRGLLRSQLCRLADRRCKRVRVRAVRSDADGTARVTIAVRRAAAHPAPAR
jgi:hypothetical protein